MGQRDFRAEITAAAWAAVAALGVSEAIKLLRGLIAELEKHQWNAP